MSSLNDPGTGPRYWKSLDELADDPQVVERMKDEFPDAADQTVDLTSRRNFFRLMALEGKIPGVTKASW